MCTKLEAHPPPLADAYYTWSTMSTAGSPIVLASLLGILLRKTTADMP
jgi:hypothetical protein